MGQNDKFCLRWNDFESNISVAFREIKEEKDFFDCTLSVGDRQLQAHKLILSACSPFFRSVLKKNPHQHPLLYLKGVEFSDLQAVLNFMYHGEVNVAQEELNSFLTVAEDLKVKGLTQNNSSNTNSTEKYNSHTVKDIPHRSTTKPRNNLSDPPPPKNPRPNHQFTSQNDDDDDIQEVMPVVKTEPVGDQQQQPTVTTFQQSVVEATSYSDTVGQEVEGALTQMEDQTGYGNEDGYDYGGYEDGYEGMEEGAAAGDTSKGMLDFVVPMEGGRHQCAICNRNFSDRPNCRRHIREKHLGTDHTPCPRCGKVLGKRYMKDHVERCNYQQ